MTLDEAVAEIERLRADKEAISQTASDYLHEIERLQTGIGQLSAGIDALVAKTEDVVSAAAEAGKANEELGRILNMKVSASYADIREKIKRNVFG